MKNHSYYLRRTKIICTIGPASGSPAVLQRLIAAGMDIARLNMSHGTLEEHARNIENIRKLSKREGVTIAILIDLPGPKYRIGQLGGGQVTLKKGSQVYLTTEDVQGSPTLLPVTLPNLARDIKKGDTVILDDGGMELKVQGIDGAGVKCRVTVGGLLREGRGLVVPGMKISVPFLTEQLREDILFAISHKPDFLALSFVTGPGDIESVKDILREHGANIPIIAKIERGEAVSNFNSILADCDGIMVARGDLGVEIPLEKVPLVQKDLIKRCNRAGKPVITATEMLESMIDEVRPTRAETTDVANAIFDGTDAIMLSAETAIGKYPVPAVKMMSAIAREAEKKLPYEQILAERRSWLERVTDELISYSACQTAHSLRAAAVVAFTESGSTARRISRYRPRAPILALTPDKDIAGKLLLYWGVRPCIIVEPTTVDRLFTLGAELARDLGIAKAGDLIIISAGIPIGQTGVTNMLKVQKVE
ncbi:MAG: pyruvate kinase [Dehalococcoidales bacterium]|jgi:pyruvate kinase